MDQRLGKEPELLYTFGHLEKCANLRVQVGLQQPSQLQYVLLIHARRHFVAIFLMPPFCLFALAQEEDTLDFILRFENTI